MKEITHMLTSIDSTHDTYIHLEEHWDGQVKWWAVELASRADGRLIKADGASWEVAVCRAYVRWVEQTKELVTEHLSS